MAVDPIQHVVVLMLENQSFDRMVGLVSGGDGIDPGNLRSNPNSLAHTTVAQNPSSQARMDFDPPHDYDDVVSQIAGTGSPCSGFVDAFVKNHVTAILRALKANRIVCLLSDRDISGDGVEVEFFGERTTMPGGPATLALRTGAPLVPAGVYFRPHGGHYARIGPPVPRRAGSWPLACSLRRKYGSRSR